MPDLANSQRRINKATYVEIRADARDKEEGKHLLIQRPFEKANYLRSLQPTRDEVARIAGNLRLESDKGVPDKRTSLLLLTGLLSSDSPTSPTLQLASAIAGTDHDTLVELGRRLASTRREMSAEAAAALEDVRERFAHHLLDVEAGGVAMDAATRSNEPNLMRNGDAATALDPGRSNAGFAKPTRLGATDVDTTSAGWGTWPPQVDTGTLPRPRVTTGAPRPSIEASIDWALAEGDPVVVALADRAKSLLRQPPPFASAEQLVAALTTGLEKMGDEADAAVDGFIEQFQIEPVGRLHLERMEMTPVGVERGELVYSIPLSPSETVNISHKEWSVRSEEFEKLVLDVQEEFSEEGVTEKTDLSQSTDSQRRHATAYSLSGTYSGYGASISVGYNSSSEDQQAQKDSRQQSIGTTRKASTRSKQEHKHSFKVTSVVGSEDQSVRVITNPSPTDSMRIDYYQLIRKWRVDLYRYGLRMTYDLVIPSPGGDLLKRLSEIRTLDGLIDEPFAFNVALAAIDRNTWQSLAAEWGAKVEFPPSATDHISRHHEASYPNETGKMEAIDFSIDPDYEISSGFLLCHFGPHNADDFHIGFIGHHTELNDLGDTRTSDLPKFVGRSGDLSISYSARNIARMAVILTFELKLKDDAFERWQYSAWSGIRAGAEESYYASRQILVDRRAALLEQLKGWDALTLRKMEREEIMKGVLRWLFGPEFELVPGEIQGFFEQPLDGGPGDLEFLSPTAANWSRIVRFGEMIKFLHHAIEWENVLYFTYPYFWDSPNSWEFKRFLLHPDTIHRDFLRAGSARVVLTIRPGYEETFAQFVETGGLVPGHPYLTIAQEIQAYAATNYKGIPPANPEGTESDEVTERERGILIGRWYEYTPTSALDLSIDTALDDLA